MSQPRFVELPETTDHQGKPIRIGDVVFSPSGTPDPACGRVAMILPGMWGSTLVILHSVDSKGTSAWWASDSQRCEKGKR